MLVSTERLDQHDEAISLFMRVFLHPTLRLRSSKCTRRSAQHEVSYEIIFLSPSYACTPRLWHRAHPCYFAGILQVPHVATLQRTGTDGLVLRDYRLCFGTRRIRHLPRWLDQLLANPPLDIAWRLCTRQSAHILQCLVLCPVDVCQQA